MPGTTKCFSQVKGSVIRVTSLDACGKPIVGTSKVAVSKKVSSVTLDVVTESTTAILDKNFNDEVITDEPSTDQILGYSGEIALIGVDPDLINIFTKNPVVLDASGNAVGFDASTEIDLESFGFAVEVWSRLAGAACATSSGNRAWGYTLFPFFKGGRLGGFSFAANSVNFTITGARTRKGNQWGSGPFNVDRGVGPAFAPAPMFTPIGVNAPFRNILVTLDPPADSCGSTTLTAAA